jgi:ketosteroid isomerase-like protein
MQRSAEIERLVGAWFDAASRGDVSLVAAHVSPGAGTRLIGSDPVEVLRGGAAVAAFLAAEVAGGGGRSTFTPRDTEAFSEGDVGWATTFVTITMPDGKYVAPRWSSVFHREDNVWKFVQTHASIAVPNDAIGWVYPD